MPHPSPKTPPSAPAPRDGRVRPDLSRFTNHRYHHGRSLPVRIAWMMCEALFLKNPMFLWSAGKVALLRLFGARIGQGVLIKPSVSIKHPWFLEIGDHCWIGEQCWIDNLAPVSIGSHCCISQGALLLTGNHNYSKVAFDFIAQPIRLEPGSWVGARAVVCPGLTLGEGAILAVGAVATRDLEPWTIYQGNPATPVRERTVTEEGRRYGGT